MKYYTLFDRITREYGVMFTAVNDSDCKRKLAFSQKDNPFTRDLELWFVGEFNQDTAAFSQTDCPVFVALMDDVMATYSTPLGDTEC
ncbi:nonstructural protein [Dipodfec virus UA23Rod_1392]|uniref:Nonstructural protein n=1 Tax=Dipodfec virus UA23Rod_1392 TaxID=2929332 RepID=A0A976N2G0_9VIRU|nr:nonstructural protein [Dipodfec virus UA23Rod_1392]